LLHQQTAIISGGSRGIGAAIAERFAREGADVILLYREQKEAASLVTAACRSYGARSIAYACDVTDSEQVKEMLEAAKTWSHHPITILVNNAGTSHYGLLTDTTESDWAHLMDVHLKGAYLLSKGLIPAWVSRGYGRIINLSSIWGTVGSAHEVLYSMAKGGLQSFTKALAKELAPSGVTVNAIAPGVIDTDMLNDLHEEDRAWLIDHIPMGRWGQPHEVASLALYLASPESSYVTGQIIGLDGGWSG
jgi:3-oxoacyl-[acyl-carrier protein] reductase